MQPGSDRLRLVCFFFYCRIFKSASQVLLLLPLGPDQLKQVSLSDRGGKVGGGMAAPKHQRDCHQITNTFVQCTTESIGLMRSNWPARWTEMFFFLTIEYSALSQKLERCSV